MALISTPGTRIIVRGERELQLAFLQVRREAAIALKPALLKVGEEVEKDSHTRAVSQIENITAGNPNLHWSEFRLGMKMKARGSMGIASMALGGGVLTPMVYVAPMGRRSRGMSPGMKRPNLAKKLLKPMQQAVDTHEHQVTEALARTIDAAELKAKF